MHDHAHPIQGIRILAFLFVTLLSAAQTGQPSGPALYLDPSQPINVRVDDLISRMTLEEKASQLVNQSRAIPRLQVPGYDWWNEALHGVARAGTATVFPEPIGLAATFDPPLIHDMATVIGLEARAKHNQAIRAGRHDIYEGLDSGRPISTSFATRAGGEDRKPTAKIPSSLGACGLPLLPDCRVMIPNIFRGSLPRNILRYTAVRSPRAIPSTSKYRSMTWRTRTCRRFVQLSPKAKPDR
jgi:beta-glucosidase